MKKIELLRIKQFETVCFIGKIDPRDLVRVATKINMGEVQDAQRPLNEKRVKSIASYVDKERGILPNTLTLASVDNRLKVSQDEHTNLYYLSFPETEKEYLECLNSIDVMDGQHRLYSFLENIRTIGEDVTYEIGFTLYERPSLVEKRKIFITCNEKQEKVSGNLLMWFREKLDMLKEDEKMFYNVVDRLSKEKPLCGHIKMSAEKITNAVSAQQLMAALKQAKIQDLTIDGEKLTDDQKVKMICTCLFAWESVVGFSFTKSKSKEAGAAIKMAGLKYMILLLPTFWEKSLTLRQRFDQNFVEDVLKDFISICAVERSSFFTCTEHKMHFRDRTAVDAFANDSIVMLKSQSNRGFNPLA